ncbi:hypothetical protein [Yunchengibacter salinarum]|uniref:hypothetical protein n=1 Tax=Yunchengibacter salinarum TaxID=3133399 RepID=UPI0035B66B95
MTPPAETRRITVHIGHAKVGSSAIQQFLQDNGAALGGRGFAVLNSALRFCAGDVADVPVSAFHALYEAGDTGAALTRAVAAAPADHHLLVSAENLSNAGRERPFRDLPESVRLRVVFYVRRRDDFLISAWKQWGLKQGQQLPAYVALRLKTGDGLGYRRAIERWQALPNVDEVLVRPLHRSALEGGDLIQDYASVLGLTDLESMTHPGRVNVSFDYELLCGLARLPDLFDGLHDNRLFQQLEASGLGRAAPGARDPLGRALRRRIQARYEAEARWLHAHWFPHLDFDALFTAMPDSAAEDSWTVTPAASLKKAAQVLGALALRD